MNKTFKIIFMGTPQFSVPALIALHENNYNVCMVVTAPDRPKGRGRKVAPPAVKVTALDLGYRVLQPASIKTAAFCNEVAQHKPDFVIVIAFGYIVPEMYWRCPVRERSMFMPHCFPNIADQPLFNGLLLTAKKKPACVPS